MYIYANSKLSAGNNWDGITYPFTFTFVMDKSIIQGYRITLLSPTQVRIVRPTEFTNTTTARTSDDRFVRTSILANTEFNEEYVYTCTTQTQALVTSRLANTALNGLQTMCNGSPLWADGVEFYNITETKVRLVTAFSTTSGTSTIALFGGWSGGGAGGEGPTNELWTFDLSSQLSKDDVPIYTPSIHDSPYNTFPCCGTVQECCGSEFGTTPSGEEDFFPTCKERRLALAAEGQCDENQCCGKMPVLNRWRRRPLSGFVDGVPLPRYGHTSNEIGTPTELSGDSVATLDYRMVVFGGNGGGQFLDDLWELSLEKQATSDVVCEFVLFCRAETGGFRLVLTTDDEDRTLVERKNLTSVRTGLIRANATVHDLKYALESVEGVSAESIRITTLGVDRLCDTKSSSPTSTNVKLRMSTNISPSFSSSRPLKMSSINVNVDRDPSSSAALLTGTKSGYVALRMSSQPTHDASVFVWSRPDRNIPSNQRPSRRAQHSASVVVDHSRPERLERLVVFGGWNGSFVLNDVWSYSPSSKWGGEGAWTFIPSNDGKYLEVKPNLILQTIEFIGFNTNDRAVATMPKRYMHTAVALTTGFTKNGAEDSEEIAMPRESLMVYGGVGEREVARGDNWNQYGHPWGGLDPDLFALCLDKDADRYCQRARPLEF
jgi:hypothetical protein